jgi:adenylate cyclase
LDQYTVPVNPWGRILVPFRGGPFSFPYISSADVLNDRTPREAVANKLVFIGSSATAVGDLYPVAVSPVFPGIEVNASIAEGIIDGYLPYKPAWGKGVVFALVLVLGISCAVLLPSVGAIVTEVVCLTLTFGLLVLKWWLWVHYGMDIEVLLPIIVIQVVVALDMLTGYFFEARGRKETRQLFNQYVSSEYIDKMFETDREFVLKGENKELTALFSDIRGFTSISESLSAPEIKEILDSYLTPMTQILFDYRGTIDKYIGDAIMAFWGAPLEDPKHACDAVNAGLAMHAKLKEFNAKAREKKWPELHIGVGINTGFMHVGDMGSKFRRAYTVIGDAVNLASRLESLTKFYHVKILVGENTYNQSKDLFIYRKIDKIRVKGKTVPVVIYEPLCAVGEGNETMRAEIALHHLALEQYFQRDWKEAERIFNELRTSYPQNGALYALFLQRIQSTPLPGPDWDGSLTMEIK